MYVSRGGEKLRHALENLEISVSGKICADAGASTGGFTDCLLQNGARKVYAIDVGYGILDWKLRNDTRVVVLERTNLRSIEKLPEPIDLTTIDVSFISLKKVLPVIKNWLAENGQILALVKPQFEASHREASKGRGVITDTVIQTRVMDEIREFAQKLSFQLKGEAESPLLGAKGNKEFFLWLSI